MIGWETVVGQGSAGEEPEDSKSPNAEQGTLATLQTIKEQYLELGRLLKRFDEAYRKAAARMGLSDSAFEILLALCYLGEGCLQRDVCQYACISKQTVNSSVQKLVREGFVHLEPADSGCGMRMFLTEEGRSMTERCVMPFARADFETFASLSDKARHAMLEAQSAYVDGIVAAFGAVPSTAREEN